MQLELETKKPSIKTEAIAGITTFFTMAYIVVVNPAILSTEGTGLPFSGVMTATVCVAFLLTLIMGLYAKLPYAVAPGMGINAFFAYSIILSQKVPWPVAFGIIFWSGVLFLLLSLTPVRESVAKAIPLNLRLAAAAGIGVFLTFIGLKSCGFITSDPVTLVRFGILNPPLLLSMLGILIAFYFYRRKNPFAFLIAIFSITTLGWFCGLIQKPEKFIAAPDFESVFLKLDFWGALKPAFIPAIVSIFFTDLFDSISTFVGVSQATKLLDQDGHPKNLKQGLIVDALATLTARLFGTSSGTAYIESSAGIEAGGRTGLTSVFTALCFLPCFFLAPLAGAVPAFATAPVLILVGVLMFKSVTQLNLEKMEDALPAFLTVILIPLTFSITQGMFWGFVFHVVLYSFAGRRKEIAPMMWVIGTAAAIMLVVQNLPRT